MYRLMVESLLGVRREADRLHITPLLPAEWPEFRLRYRYRDTEYAIHVQHASGDQPSRLQLDGEPQAGLSIDLQDDRIAHAVEVWVGTPRRDNRAQGVG
jgi:cellobiose phosphorylase